MQQLRPHCGRLNGASPSWWTIRRSNKSYEMRLTRCLVQEYKSLSQTSKTPISTSNNQGQLEKPTRLQAWKVFRRRGQSGSQGQWFQVRSFWCWKEELSRDDTCFANYWNHVGKFSTKLWALASPGTLKARHFREGRPIQLAHIEAFYCCCQATVVLIKKSLCSLSLFNTDMCS